VLGEIAEPLQGFIARERPPRVHFAVVRPRPLFWERAIYEVQDEDLRCEDAGIGRRRRHTGADPARREPQPRYRRSRNALSLERRGSMRALVLEGHGLDGLVWRDRPDPTPAAGQVVIRLKAAALNHRDLWACRRWTDASAAGVLGSDGAGIVEAAGEGVADLARGAEVVINPSLNWPAHQPFPGPEFEILGRPTDGTFAERVVVPRLNVFPKPTHLSFAEAAALPLSGLTAWHALVTTGQLVPGETVLVPGVGGGTASVCVQLAHALGARVIATSRDPTKRERALALGAAIALDSASPFAEAIDVATGGADLVIESVGRATWTQSLKSLKRGGRIVVYGSTSGDVIEVDLAPFFLGWRSILGSTMGHAGDFAAMLAFIERHRLVPTIDRVFPFAEAVEAFRHLDASGQFGKVVLQI
jgi:zinc-binding alcohol dehydrogenase/oxidoreductase